MNPFLLDGWFYWGCSYAKLFIVGGGTIYQSIYICIE